MAAAPDGRKLLSLRSFENIVESLIEFYTIQGKTRGTNGTSFQEFLYANRMHRLNALLILP